MKVFFIVSSLVVCMYALVCAEGNGAGSGGAPPPPSKYSITIR